MTEPLELPATSDIWADWLRGRFDAEIGAAIAGIAELKDGTARDTAAVLDLWNDADLALDNAAALAGLMAEVHPDEDVRTLAEERAQEVSRIVTDRGLDRALYEVVAATEEAGDEQTAAQRGSSCATSGAAVSTSPRTSTPACARSPSGSSCSTRSSAAPSATTSARCGCA